MRWEGNLNTQRRRQRNTYTVFGWDHPGNLGADGRIFTLLLKKYNVQM